MKKNGKSKAFLRSLRKKYGLGEFKKTARARKKAARVTIKRRRSSKAPMRSFQ